MTAAKVGLAAVLAASAFVVAVALTEARFQAASDVSVEPIRLGPTEVEIVTPATPTVPPGLGEGAEVQVDRIISYSRSPEYLPHDGDPARPGR